MAGKTRVTDANVAAANEIYKVAREQADIEIAALKEQLGSVHNFGLLAGRAQGFKAMRLLSEFLEDKQTAEIIDKQEHLKIPGVKNVGDYLELLGLGRSVGFDKLKIARTLTADEVRFFGLVGFTRRDLLGYASLPDEQRLEIMDGKVINLETATREDIKDLVEQLVAETKTAKEETEATLRAKDKVLKSKEELLTKQEKTLARLEKQARAKNLLPEEDAIIGRIEDLGVMLNGYALSIEAVFDLLQENPFHSGVAAFLTLMDNIKMRVNAFRETVAADLAPAGMVDDDEWLPPPLRPQTENPECVQCRSNQPASCPTPGKCCKGCPVGCSPQQYCAIKP